MLEKPPFSIAALRHVVDNSFVTAIDFHGELPSTNDRALQLAAEAERATPLLVLTARQTAGRGRGANHWWSAPGALTFSLILDKRWIRVPVERWPQISLTIGLAVCDAIERLVPGIHVGLKWPNDVYVDDRKVCGILIEVPAHAAGRFVIGVGLNVNNSFQQAPPDVASNAASLADRIGYPLGIDQVLIALLDAIVRHLALLGEDDQHLANGWREYCVLTGSLVCVEGGDRPTEGRCLGIDQEGALLIATDEGERRFLAGTVRRMGS